MPEAASLGSITRMTLHTFARWWLYPLLWIWTLGWIVWAAGHADRVPVALGIKAVGMVGVLLLFEWLTPLKQAWGMTTRLFLHRDLVMIVVNGVCIGLLNYALVLLSISVATTADGIMAGAPLLLQIVVGLLAFEALQYSVHRLMHKDAGPVSTFLWRSHAIHHLPQQLYVVMHAVFHPVNAVLVRILVQLTPIWVFGFDPFAVFVYGSIIALHGTVSHLNIDLRMGALNYLFVGPELHRFHHSAQSHEAQNYGAALSVFDQAFGTFLYRPGEQPQSLGLRIEDGYPGQQSPWRALLFPFRREQRTGSRTLAPLD